MKEPRINIDRLVNQIVLDCSLLRWFSYNGRRQDVMIAIDVQRSRARDLEGHLGLPGPALRRPAIKRQKITSRAANKPPLAGLAL